MSQSKSNFGTILLTIIITAIVILGAGYYSQQHAVKTIQVEKLPTLESQKSVDTTTTNDTPVYFLREGLLTEKEKTEIKENFVNPLAECDRTTTNPANPTVAMVITVPQNIGEAYSYISISKKFGGSEGSYGKRGEPIPAFKCVKDGIGT